MITNLEIRFNSVIPFEAKLTAVQFSLNLGLYFLLTKMIKIVSEMFSCGHSISFYMVRRSNDQIRTTAIPGFLVKQDEKKGRRLLGCSMGGSTHESPVRTKNWVQSNPEPPLPINEWGHPEPLHFQAELQLNN